MRGERRTKNDMRGEKGQTAGTVSAIVARVVLGAVFVLSGAVKAVDPMGTVYKIEDYLKAFGGFFDDLMPLAPVAAVCLIALEFVLGVCLLGNVRTAWTAWVTLAFYAVMTPLTLYIAIANPVSDCGCFGDALKLTNWQTFGKNIVLIALAVLLVVLRKRQPSRWKPVTELVIACAALLGVCGWMLYTCLHLPVIDFRPYKVGTNIADAMQYPEDAPADVYDIRFVYAKDGKQQTFTLDNYPKGDSTWVFVRQDSRLVQKGYEPPVHDFEIMNADYEDITYDILESEEPVTLVIMYDLAKADRRQMDKVEKLCIAGAADGDGRFYILTGSGGEAVRGLTAAHPVLEGTVCTCDPVTLKTIVRANPGVIVVQNGTIVDKYNLRNR